MSLIPKLRRFVMAVVVTAGVCLVAAPPASANAHPSSWSWTSNRAYAPSQIWILESPNAQYTAKWQTDSNLVIYNGSNIPSHAVWASGSNGSDGYFYLLSTGRMVIRQPNVLYISCPDGQSNYPWDNHWSGASGKHTLSLNNSGTLTETNALNQVTWNSHYNDSNC